MGFTNPPIGEALALDALHGVIGAHGVGVAKRGATVVAEIKLRQIAVKVGFAAVLVDAGHAALEDAEIALNRVGVDGFALAIADVLTGAVCLTASCPANSWPVAA